MSFSPYPALKADAAVRALLGSPLPRAYPFGEAPQQVAAPYVVWRLISGLPENYLGDRPDMDSIRLQFDAYALTQDTAQDVAAAVIQALETEGHQVSDNGDDREPETRLWRKSFDFEFWPER